MTLTAYWRLEGDARDRTGNGNDMTVSNTTYLADATFGQVMRATTGSRTLADNPSVNLNGKTKFSCAFWAQSFNSNQTFVHYISKGSFDIYTSEAGRIRFAVTGVSASFTQTSQFLLNADGLMHFIVCVYNGANSKIYLDKILRANSNITGDIDDAGTTVLALGGHYSGGFNPNSAMARVRYLPDTELTQTDVNAMYDADLAKLCGIAKAQMLRAQTRASMLRNRTTVAMLRGKTKATMLA